MYLAKKVLKCSVFCRDIIFGRLQKDINHNELNMILEIDSSNIIAVLVKNTSKNDQQILQYKRIRDLAKALERRIPTMLTYCDMLSIDAFRTAFQENVIMRENELLINRFSEIEYKIERLLPSNSIISLIEELNQSLNEENP